MLAACGYYSGADGLGEYQNVSGLCVGVGYLPTWFNQANDGKSVFGFCIINGVAANYEAAGLRCFIIASSQSSPSISTASSAGNPTTFRATKGFPPMA